MDISTEIIDQAAVVKLDGNLTGGGAEDATVDEIVRVVDGGHQRIVLDLEALLYVDSAGLGALIRCHKRCAEAQSELRLCGVNQRLMMLLKMARLDDILVIFDDRAAALAAEGG